MFILGVISLQDQPPPPPPQPLQPQMRFPGPPPPGSYPYGQMPPPPGTIPGMPPMNMFPALPSGFHQPDFSQPPPGVINVNGQLQYPGPPPPGLLPPPSMLQQPPVILRASAALTHESSVMPAITPTSKDEAAPVFTSSLHKLDPRFSFDDSDDQIEVQVQDSPTPPLNEYEESRCSSTTTVVLLDSKLVDEPDAENNAPRSVHTEEALAEDTRTEDPPGEHPSIDVTISKGPTKEVPWKATRKAVSSTTLPRKLSDKGPSTKTRTKSHDDDYALGSIPATAFSTKSLDRSLGRHKRSNSGSGNVLVEDVMMQHRDVSHLFWAVDRDVGAPDLHPVKLFADVAQMAASDATVVEEAAIAVGHASLSRKKSLLGKVVAAESAASDMPTLPVAAAAEESDDSFVVLNPEMLGNLGGSLSRTRSFKQSHVVITADGVTDVASGEKMPTSPETTPPIAEALPIAMIGKAEEAAEKDGIPKGGDSAQPFANFYDYTVPPEKLQINNGTVLAEPTLPVVEMPADTEGGDDASMREKWNWISGKIPERSSSKGKVAPHPTLVDDVITADGKFLEPPTEQSLGHRSSLSDDEFAYPDQNDPHFNGFPRYPLHIEKSIYQLSHAKLAQARRPLIHQVMISNLMLYILSVHADVTIHRQGPRKNRNKKKKKGGKKKKRTATKEEADASDSDSGGAVFIHQSGLQQPVNGPLIVLENPNKQQKRRSTSSISSVSSLDSNGSFASESESEIEHAAPAAEGSSGFGLFGGNKKSAKGASAKSGGALNMAMGLYRAMGRNLARKKSQTLIGNGDDDDVPLAVLAGKN
ncbi:hypothetical protein BC830DRAFT_1114412 [Chytriomyces sp. MP71]|nr:hypothetical protein BC830DRAFT_1114412 [Chytriomyces sp. MP71]